MVAKITSPHSVKRALNYNEKKVQNGQAVCIYAGNFLKDLGKMNFYDKLQRFQDLISLNDRAQKSNTLHISLNFQPSEKLNQKILTSIANEYMERIGFGKQPYLIYEHRDAGHPHIHIVTTNIDSTGKRIDTYNIGKLKSEVARNEIENKFGLVRATNVIQTGRHKIDIRKVEYGKVETKRAITKVLDEVMTRYNFNSLSSFNAILKTFNVLADRGKEGGRIHKFKGLLYYILNQKGEKVSVPIKSSLIYSKPTLERLESLFKINEPKRNRLCLHLRNRVYSELNTNSKSLVDFVDTLKKTNIDTVLRQNETGLIYGITFVDHLNKAVFNGSELGKQFSAAAIQKKFQIIESIPTEKARIHVKANSNTLLNKKSKYIGADTSILHGNAINSTLKDLLRTEQEDHRLLYPLLAKRRKKKRKLLP
jgi:hypothetical protein